MIRHVHKRKVAIAIGLTLAFLLTAFFGRTFGVSYYRRWQASKLLAVIRQFDPGTTTEAQARATLKPFAHYEVGTERLHEAGSEYAFENSFPLPWTRFSVDINFANGMVTRIHLLEMQVDHRGYPHPNAASVTIYSHRVHPLPDDFSGYSERSQSTGSVDSQGHWTGFDCCHARFIQLDERASPAQLSRSLNFQLHCMTSFLRCKDDHQILP